MFFRQCVAPDFYLDPVKDAPPKTRLPTPRTVVHRPEKRYCCIDCYKVCVFNNNGLFDNYDIAVVSRSTEEIEAHIQQTARHRQPRSNTPPGFWDIGFPDSD